MAAASAANPGTEQAIVRVAMVGTRGVPARYGGFETAVEEIGRRLVERGHQVTVYCRPDDPSDAGEAIQCHGIERLELPALRRRSLETLSHTLLSSVDAWWKREFDVVFLFNAANAPFIPLLRRRSTPVAVHVDGLESRRAKWGGAGRRYYRITEGVAVRWADALIADAEAIARYYADEFSATTEQISYGAPLLDHPGEDGLGQLGLESGRYHLVVARFEPENHVDLIVRGYRRSDAAWPLVVVGSAPYAHEYSSAVRAAAGDDQRIHLLGPVWDQELLDRLYHHAVTYVHGHSVGGTNPSLLRAMGATTAVIAYDVVFAREVLGEAGVYFGDEAALACAIETAETDPDSVRRRAIAGRARAERSYRWDDVASAYEALGERLTVGWSRRGEVSGRRRRSSPWSDGSTPST